jgi:hypothetical protein
MCVSGACVDPASVWLVSGLSSPGDLAADSTRLYWTNTTDGGTGTVNAIDKDGGSVVELATGQANPGGVAVDDTYVYWTNNLGGAVMRTAKDGSGTPQLVAATSSPWFIALDATYAYIASSQGLLRADKTGAGTPTVVWGAGGLLATDGTALYTVTNIPGLPTGEEIQEFNFATQTAGLYVSASLYPPAEVHQVSAIGADPYHPGAVAVADSINNQIYWGNNAIYEGSNASPALAFVSCGVAFTGVAELPGLRLGVSDRPNDILLMASAYPMKIVTDAANIYWLDYSKAIGKIPIP